MRKSEKGRFLAVEEDETAEERVVEDRLIEEDEQQAAEDDGMKQSVKEEGAAMAPPPDPEDVEPQCPFTAEDTVQLHAAAHPTGPSRPTDTDSLYVNAEDVQSELNSITPATVTNATSAEEQKEEENIMVGFS